MFEEKSPDIVLAAGNVIKFKNNIYRQFIIFLDVVFDQTMFESLCNCLKYFIIKNSTEIILFCTLRNPETHKQFLETLGKQYAYIIINICIFLFTSYIISDHLSKYVRLSLMYI